MAPAAASPWRFTDQLAGIGRPMCTIRRIGPAYGAVLRIAARAAIFTRFSYRSVSSGV